MIRDTMKKKSNKLQVYQVGDCVEVILNTQNKTPHIGIIRDIIWHHKYEEWNYFIEVNGKKVSKRYLESDLRKR